MGLNRQIIEADTMVIPEPLKKILLIEDHQEIAEQVGEYLEARKFHVLFSRNASDAILKCSNEKFFCILTDINLEKGTGDTVIMNIKNAYSNPNYSTPIIVLSSAINAGLMDKVKDLIDWAFVKPYILDSLYKKIEEVTSKPAKVHKS